MNLLKGRTERCSAFQNKCRNKSAPRVHENVVRPCVVKSSALSLISNSESTSEPLFANAASNAVKYAIKLAATSEAYEVHTWTLLLGILKQEDCTACQVLKSLGLEDLYGAWHEVLWALNVCDGLKPRAFTYHIAFNDVALRIVESARIFAKSRGSETVQSEDLLLSFSAFGVLNSLFPDVSLNFDRVRSAIEKHTGCEYKFPNENEPRTDAQNIF